MRPGCSATSSPRSASCSHLLAEARPTAVLNFIREPLPEEAAQKL